jgi:hypothetical protein
MVQRNYIYTETSLVNASYTVRLQEFQSRYDEVFRCGRPNFAWRGEQGTCLLFRASRPTLGPTQRTNCTVSEKGPLMVRKATGSRSYIFPLI